MARCENDGTLSGSQCPRLLVLPTVTGLSRMKGCAGTGRSYGSYSRDFLHKQIKVQFGRLGWEKGGRFTPLDSTQGWHSSPKVDPGHTASFPRALASSLSQSWTDRKGSVNLLQEMRSLQAFSTCHSLRLQSPPPCKEIRRPFGLRLVVQSDLR